MTLVDTHCHLDDDQFDADREAVVARARAAGVERMMAIGGPAAVKLTEDYEGFYAAVGTHPHEAVGGALRGLAELARHPKVLAIGEIGLDYHYDFSPRETQRRVFEEQLVIARDAAKPIVIHTREAWDDTFAILEKHGLPNGGIMHCFTGGPAEAQRCLEMGFYLAFGGMLTFPKAQEIRDAAALTPLDRLLVETDAPYLAPIPYRGKRNEPAYILKSAARLAELKLVTLEQLAEATTRNFEAVCLRQPDRNR